MQQYHTMGRKKGGQSSEEDKGDSDDLMTIVKTIRSEMVTKKDMKDLEKKIDSLESTVKFATDKALQAIEKADNVTTEVEELKDELSHSNAKLSATKARCDYLESRLMQLEDHTRKDNLIFDGVPKTEDENCGEKIKRILKDQMKINDVDGIIFQRVHRMNQRNQQDLPAPIICRFLNYNDRMRVWSMKKHLKNTKIFIREDYAPDVIDQRKKLLPIMKRAKSLGHEAFLIKNRLNINNKWYTVNNLSDLPDALQPEKIATKKVSDDIVGFFTAASPLSNFYDVELTLDGHTFHCVEQYLQYNKAIFAEKPEVARKILAARTPNVCKVLGDHINVNQDEWLIKAKEFVEKACSMKFLHNAHARACLLNTVGCTLVEASPNTTWGAGFHLNEPELADKKKWTGQNALGNILMKIRDSLQIQTTATSIKM